MYDNGKQRVRRRDKHPVNQGWHTATHFPPESPSSLVVMSIFWSRFGLTEICCLLFSANRKNHWLISLYNPAVEECRDCTLNHTKIHWVISFPSLALSVRLLTSCFHFLLRVTLCISSAPLSFWIVTDWQAGNKSRQIIWKHVLDACCFIHSHCICYIIIAWRLLWRHNFYSQPFVFSLSYFC